MLRPYLVNWVEVVRYFVRSVEADAAADGTPETAALLKRLLAMKASSAAVNAPPAEPAIAPVLPMHFRKGDDRPAAVHDHRDAAAIPQDITLQELRVRELLSRWMRRPLTCSRGMNTGLAGILADDLVRPASGWPIYKDAQRTVFQPVAVAIFAMSAFWIAQGRDHA